MIIYSFPNGLILVYMSNSNGHSAFPYHNQNPYKREVVKSPPLSGPAIPNHGRNTEINQTPCLLLQNQGAGNGTGYERWS
ncbi:hypothetical protein P152DRAFT_156583 [Eremomyces bilateralis CBS 781.70]|uniref:Uncharacterized protein n=1 Tax=Eremomyces bilateralis CBS 781.70 TaxID=1392243 RepID=A0A6G1FUV1_9PEZI|nr:uncharacterized protein P152DRAFT_156583 [Eremomyces bilateralis CBS 781.70]KAF1809675.1 hypothetical protein P152DRAFT_156583 [Eremomyces bilateralis CBS 781.70]